MPSILVVEDDPIFARTLEGYLARAGYEVEAATDTLIALNKAEARRFDMFVVDWRCRPASRAV